MFRFVQIVFLLLCFAIKDIMVSENRIIGGFPIKIEKAPYIVQIGSDSKDGQLCGGALIAPNWVLSAAHCFEDYQAQYLHVRAGTRIRNEGGEVRNVIKVVNHPEYNDDVTDFDIALLEVDEPFTLSGKIKLIKMTDEDHEDENERCQISGWGVKAHRPYYTAFPSNVLRTAFVYPVNRDDCIDRLPSETITQRMICAGGDKQDSCQGDSGGPLVCKKKVTGLISFGIGCGARGVPGVYTRVASFRPWIREITGI